jgi:hypothetical protein
MNREKQRIAIAEACGWKPGKCPCGEDICNAWKTPAGDNWEYLPDYLTDLNAMHQAEMVLSRGEHYNQTGGFGLYVKNLGLVRCGRLHLIEATAAERAEAFLRTVGKWEDDK